MAISAAAVALRAKLSDSCGGIQLSVKHVIDPLVYYVDGRGESIADLPFTPNSENLEEWRDDWRTIFTSANMSNPVDQRNCLKYLEFLGGVRTGSAVAAAGSAAQTALMALESVGVTIPATAVATLERALTVSEAGSALKQCRDNPVLLGALYCGWTSIPEDAEAWLKRALAAIEDDGVIDMAQMPGYSKQLKNTTSNMLERALRTRQGFEEWMRTVPALTRRRTRRRTSCRTHRGTKEGQRP